MFQWKDMGKNIDSIWICDSERNSRNRRREKLYLQTWQWNPVSKMIFFIKLHAEYNFWNAYIECAMATTWTARRFQLFSAHAQWTRSSEQTREIKHYKRNIDNGRVVPIFESVIFLGEMAMCFRFLSQFLISKTTNPWRNDHEQFENWLNYKNRIERNMCEKKNTIYSSIFIAKFCSKNLVLNQPLIVTNRNEILIMYL